MAALATAVLATGLSPAAAQEPAESAQWISIPAPSNITLGEGTWQPSSSTSIVVAAEDWAALELEAERLSAELGDLLGSAPVIRPGGTPGPADIVLDIDETGSTSEESFTLVVGDDGVAVTGASAAGTFYGTRQIMHNLRAQELVPFAVIDSAPAVAERSLHIDMARKFYTHEWMLQRLRDLADVGINTIELHFSENEGFRIESAVPGVSSEQAASHEQVQELIALAESLHMQVVPSLDMPGHLAQVLSTYPDFRLDSTGGPVASALDITNPEAVALARQLVDEFAVLFEDSTYWNLGADEFVDFGHMERYPDLAAYAQEYYDDPTANGFDALNAFTNEMTAYIEAKGFTVRVWNDGQWRGNVSTLVPTAQVTWWTNWSGSMQPVETALANGHDIVNFNDSVSYYVLGQNAGYRYPTAQRYWDRDWHPGMFPTLPPNGAPQEWQQPYPEWLVGASFAIWSDRPDAQTEQQVADGIRGPLRALAERSWNAGSSLTIEQFEAASVAIGAEAPVAISSPGPVIDRISGTNRVLTSIAASQAAYADGADVVYIASGRDFPDGLSAGPAAAHDGGPLLLSTGATLSDALRTEIERLSPSEIVIVGGPAAIPAGVEADVAGLADSVERIAGVNRFETSRLVAEHAFADGATSAFIATGVDFADALAAGAAAGAIDAPVVLVQGAESQLGVATLALLSDLGVTETFVAGGTAAVSDGIVTSLEEAQLDPTRHAGSTRFVTAVEIAQAHFPESASAFVASGTAFPDALTASAIAGANGAPLYLAEGSCASEDVISEIDRLGARVTLVGGTSALGLGVELLELCA